MIARTILEARIAEVREALRRARLLRHLAAVFMLGILVRGSFLVAAMLGHHVPRHMDRWSMLGLIVLGFIAWLKGRRNIWSDREISRIIEQQHPVLDSVLITAIEYEPDAAEPTSFLHERLIDHALGRAATQNWPVTVANKPYTRALAAAWLAVLTFIATDIALRLHAPDQKADSAVVKEAAPDTPTAFAATLTPGDAELERGSRLIVEARFSGPVPADATLVVTELDGKERDRIPMRLTVDEQVFGGLISKIDRDAKYHVEFAGQKSQQHTLTTFVFPVHERVDVVITPPAYTGQPAKEIKNTLKVTALEGSSLGWKIKVNKPVTAAELFGEDKSIIELKPSAGDATLLEATMPAEKSQKYRLHLVDERDRANKNPPWITVTVQANSLAKIELVFPKRDLQVSAIQELPVEAKVSDDLGVTKSGAVFSINGNSKEILFKHATTEPKKKQDVRAELALEQENAQPRQLVSYYLWAEDTGPKGEVRRAMSDMFFADVRHFEDIFREMEAPPSEPGEPKEKAESDKLVELQKQIVNATWRIIRDTNAGRLMEAAAPDVNVVHESQNLALEQTKEAMEKVEDAEAKNALTEAWKSMKDALDPLQQAAADKKRTPLNQALTYEQSALEWLHRAQSREHQVMRQNSPPPKGGQGQQANKNQLMDLELKQQDQRYEEEKAATEEQTAEQQENLQVLNRLKELARRQEALAEKMKELQNQLAKAKTEAEKEELDNQLKRLQAEQENLLRDLDDLRDRMEQPDNAANMAEAKEQLDQTREKVVETAEQLKEEKLAEAANTATRAQRELEKMQEDFRQKTSKKFADEMKQMRQQAREAAERQKQISESLENQKTPGATDAGDNAKELAQMLSNAEISRKIADQQEQLEKLLNSMREVSEQAEASEPLLHRNLYDAVRKAQTAGLEENLKETHDQLRDGTRADAKDAERKAAQSVEDLQKGVEKAAESVLGSESEALRVAKNELDKLIKEAQQATEGPEGAQAAKTPADKSDTSDKSDAAKSQQAAQGKQPGDDAKKGEGTGQETADSKKSGKGQGGDPKAKGEGKEPGEDQGEGDPSKGGGPGDQPPQAPQMAQNGEGEGKQPGEGKGEGKEPSQDGKGSEQPGQGKGEGSQQASAEAPGKGEGKGQGKGEQPGEGQSQTADANQPRNGQPKAGTNRNGDNRGNQIAGGPTSDRDSDNDRFTAPIQGGAVPESLFFEDSTEAEDRSVFTGNGYEQWSDRLRNVEELLNQPELRNEVAKVLDNARSLRIDLKRSNETPQVASLNTRITQPLMELRDRVVEELSKKDAGKNLAPVDRDPVPAEFRDLVKRYYQELGAGK